MVMRAAAGVFAGGALLAAIAWAMLRYTAMLSIAQFFRYSSILIAALAFVLVGKGIAAIEEAGLIGVTPLSLVPRIDWLGVQPIAQVTRAQLAASLALVVGFAFNHPPSRSEMTPFRARRKATREGRPA